MTGLRILSLLLLGFHAVAAHADGVAKHRVPEGFIIEQVAGEPETVFPMFGVFDDRGRLFVAESSGLDLYKEISALTRKCRIRLLEDPDERGRFRKSVVWADGLVFPMGLAWRDGKLYVADARDLITLEDSAGKGKADKRTVILSGFGHRDNGSLHGLIFGPDGWLYMTVGDPDGFTLKQKDGTLAGTTGALLRCRPDGSEVEALCSGFENLVEIAFTPRGEIIGTDNWYQNPIGGIRDALVHLVPGGRYPRHAHKTAPLPFTGEPLPAISLFPAVAFSGLMRCEGTAIPGYRGHLFAAQHNGRRLSRHVLVPQGASFRSEDHDFLTTADPDFHPSDVFESADGSLYVIDTGSWYVQHCPTGQIRKAPSKGGIYRIRPKKMPALADPWGLKVDWKNASNRQLRDLLKDARPVVRQRAQRQLSDRGAEAIPELATLLKQPDRPELVQSKLHAVWALAGMTSAEALQPLAALLNDPGQPMDVRITAARALGMRRARAHEEEIARLLGHDDLAVRLAAAEALSRCGTVASVPHLWKALTGPMDRMLEHAAIHALHHLADAKALAKALDEAHPRVQSAALLLLDQPPRPKGILKADAVLGRLASPDADLRRTALEILQKHREWAEQARDLLRRRLAKAELTAEEQAGLRSLILAFQDQKPIQELVAGTLTGKETVSARRVLLLETLAEARLPRMPPAWSEALATVIGQPEPAVRAAAVRAAATLQVPALDQLLSKLAETKTEAAALRLEALRAVILRRPKLSVAAFDLLLDQLDREAEPLTRLAAAEVLGRSQLSEQQLTMTLAGLRKETLISPAVLLPALERSVTDATSGAFVDYLAEALKTGWRPTETELKRALISLPAKARSRAEEVHAVWRESRSQQAARLAEFEPLLKEGDAVRGRQVFFSKKAACATCHRIGNDGGAIGPDLTRLGAVRAGRDILESIVLPSSTFAQGYEPYLVVTKSGRNLTGILAGQTADTILVRDASGAQTRWPRDQIEELRRSSTSIMPEGLERALTRAEFRDLLAFLQSLK